jgi:hypothetical protein
MGLKPLPNLEGAVGHFKVVVFTTGPTRYRYSQTFVDQILMQVKQI